MKSTDWAYLAGFVDGEGCIKGRKDVSRSRPNIVVVQKEPTHLKNIYELFNVGNYRQTGRGHYGWYINDAESVRFLLEGMIPYLRLKREQALVALAMLVASPEETRLLAKRLSDLKKVKV